MGLFHKRPLAIAALMFILSGALAFFSSADMRFLAVAAFVLAVGAVLALYAKNKKLIPVLILIFAMSATGFARSFFYRAEYESLLHDNRGTVKNVELTINSRQFSAIYLTSYEATVTKIDGDVVETDVIFRVPYEDGLLPGTKISATVAFSDFSTEDDGFNEKLYYNSKGIHLIAEETDGTEYVVITKNSTVNRLTVKLARLRTSLITKLSSHLPGKNGLPAAVFLGDRSGLTDIDKMHFRRTGTYHLLSLSGMHLAVLAGILEFFLRAMWVKKGKRLAVIAPLIIFYVALTGFSLSVVRSAIMLLMSYLAYFVRRESDPLTTLLFAGAAICAVSPNAISDIGFILSMSTTFGIIAFYPAIEAKIMGARKTKILGRMLYYILSSVGISFVALSTSLPISWLYFGKLTLLSPIGTLFLSPLISALMLLTPLTMLFGAIPFLGEGLGYLTVWASEGALFIAKLLAMPSKIELSLDYAFTPFFFVPFFAIMLIIIFFKLKRVKYFFISAFAIMLCFCVTHSVYVPTTALSSTFLCYGENEYFIFSEGGANVLIDLSDGTYAKMSRAAAEATSKGYCRIDALVLTHYHKRHISSVSRLIKNNPVGQIILSEPINEAEAEILLSIIETAEDLDIETSIYPKDGAFTVFSSIDVSLDRAYIKASSHPILWLNIEGEVDISYFGSSYAAWREVKEAKENIILGTHGPVAKKEFSIPISSDTRLLSFADRAMAELMTRNSPKPPENCRVLLEPVKIEIK